MSLFAEIDQDDTNWFVTLKDIGPDVSVRTVREGEREVPENLPERELTRGWLKASHRALDPKRSKPWRPWHPLTRNAQKKVKPGEIIEYAIEIMATANLFRRGHRICVEIAAADMPTGVGGATNAEYVPNHIVSSATTLHKIYHDSKTTFAFTSADHSAGLTARTTNEEIDVGSNAGKTRNRRARSARQGCRAFRRSRDAQSAQSRWQCSAQSVGHERISLWT